MIFIDASAEKPVHFFYAPYPVVFATREIANLYNVSAYPTIYLIDQDGNILHAQSSFGEGTEDTLEDIIRKTWWIDIAAKYTNRTCLSQLHPDPSRGCIFDLIPQAAYEINDSFSFSVCHLCEYCTKHPDQYG